VPLPFVVTSSDLNLLDKAVLGLALYRRDMEYQDKWAIVGGKSLLAFTLAWHTLLACRDILDLQFPSRPWVVAGFIGVGAFWYIPVDFLLSPVEELQNVQISQQSRRWYQMWGLLIAPFSLLVWIPVWYFLL